MKLGKSKLRIRNWILIFIIHWVESRLSLTYYRYVTVTVMAVITVIVWSGMTLTFPNMVTFTPHYRYRYVTVTVITV
jgi:hypothetical protein